mmetsp:Transcript_82014/g.228593  ORF Transcript_82014/g.228593 Transcript_82014/m.228593 type:complete len:254 (-) Transcript_82014:449-1210(-)
MEDLETPAGSALSAPNPPGEATATSRTLAARRPQTSGGSSRRRCREDSRTLGAGSTQVYQILLPPGWRTTARACRHSAARGKTPKRSLPACGRASAAPAPYPRKCPRPYLRHPVLGARPPWSRWRQRPALVHEARRPRWSHSAQNRRAWGSRRIEVDSRKEWATRGWQIPMCSKASRRKRARANAPSNFLPSNWLHTAVGGPRRVSPARRHDRRPRSPAAPREPQDSNCPCGSRKGLGRASATMCCPKGPGRS